MKQRILWRLTHSSWSTRIWIALLSASMGLHLYKIGTLPIGMDFDQVREAFQAGELYKHFTTILDNLLFLHLFSIGLFQKIFGFGLLSNHVNALFWFVLTLFPVYWLTRDLFGTTVARLGLLLLNCSIIAFNSIRIAHIAITTPFFAFLALWAYYRLFRTGLYRYVWLLGITLGIGFYSSPAFKAVLLTLPFFLILLVAIHFLGPPWKRPEFENYGRALWQGVLVIGLFFSVICLFEFGLTDRSFSWNRLYFLLIGYRSNGQLIGTISQLFENCLALLSQCLPVRYVRQHHLIITRLTGNAEAQWYISPLISGFFLISCLAFLFAMIRYVRRGLSRRQRPCFEPTTYRSACCTRWRKECDWLFAASIVLGGCSSALLSDHVGARRWIYAWFWIYPLAAVSITMLANRLNKRIALSILAAITLCSQVYPIYTTYLRLPWRSTGPTPAVIQAINKRCQHRVYMTSLLAHWVRHYRKLQPLACTPEILHEQPVQQPYHYLVFDIENNYRPQKFGSDTPVLTFKSEEGAVFTEQFRDQWGFQDYNIITLFPLSSENEQAP